MSAYKYELLKDINNLVSHWAPEQLPLHLAFSLRECVLGATVFMRRPADQALWRGCENHDVIQSQHRLASVPLCKQWNWGLEPCPLRSKEKSWAWNQRSRAIRQGLSDWPNFFPSYPHANFNSSSEKSEAIADNQHEERCTFFLSCSHRK